MLHVFISYVRENEAIVERLCGELRKEGVEPWRDRDKIEPGQRWRQAIRQAIQRGAFFVACFSKEYAERDSTYMNEEVTLAIEELRKRPTDRAWFIPVLLSDCQVPDRDIGGGATLRDLQWVALWDDWSGGFRRILAAVKAAPSDKPSSGPALAKLGLSEQALSILRQFVESGDEQFFYANWGGGQWSLQLCHGDQRQLEVTEPRFLQDDLDQLVAQKLLTVEYNTDGHGIYGITRDAVRLISS
jgi:hypothetical protein